MSHIIQSVLALGVSGYIPKSTSSRELAEAISEVLRGEIYLPAHYRDAARTREAEGRPPRSPETPA